MPKRNAATNEELHEMETHKKQKVGEQSKESKKEHVALSTAERFRTENSTTHQSTSTNVETKETKTEKKQNQLEKALGNNSTPKKMTVQSILPNPTNNLIDDEQVRQYSDGLRARLETVSKYVNKPANVYSLPNILPNATWGRYHPLNDHSKDLCNPTTNEPIMIWIVGHLVTLWFEKNGVPEKQASITLAPLSNSLRLQALKLLAGFSEPQEASVDSFAPALRATKWQISKDNDNMTLFNSVYDARDVLRSKNEMEKLSPVDLKKNDLVLLETRMTHYRVKDIKTDKWGHRAQLEMHAISLLHRPTQKDEQEDEKGDIKDLYI